MGLAACNDTGGVTAMTIDNGVTPLSVASDVHIADMNITVTALSMPPLSH